MDYKPNSALYLCADDSEEMPSFEDMRHSDFSYNNPYTNIQNDDNSLQYPTNSVPLKSEHTEQISRKIDEEVENKPYIYESEIEDEKPSKEKGSHSKPSADQSNIINKPIGRSELNILNGITNSRIAEFDNYNYDMNHSKMFEGRVNECDLKSFIRNYHDETQFSDKPSGQELYDGDTEEEEVKDMKNEIQNLLDQDDRLSEGNDFDDDNEEDDETDVERQNHEDEDENNPESLDQLLEADHQLEVPEESAATTEEGPVTKKPKKSKSGKKRREGDETKSRKKRKRRDSGEPLEKKAKTDAQRKNLFERKNIRKIFEDENLDEETKAAQKEEMERKQRLLEIQEKLKQQALELRAQREREMSNHLDLFHKREGSGNSSLKSLLEDKADAADIANILESNKAMQAIKPKVTDVVEISSSEEEENEEDDDDDLIVMSDVEEEPDDGEEDTENSGSHVNDAINRPDANGCVLVNVGHPPDEADIFLAPQLASAVKPHQIGGIRFMYDNIVESLERYKTSNGFGCILAHSMGLGKTVQVVSFVDIFLRHTGAKSVLIIVPVNTLQNWINEFNMWLPVVDEAAHMGGGIDREILWPREFKLYYINDNMKTTNCRTKIVGDWHRTGGVLLLGYEMYRLLIKTRGVPVKSRRTSKKTSSEPVVIDVEEEEVNKEIVKNLHEALMRPGPDLVICDEGHRIKNSHASISQVLKNIRTRRRVVLTGYPLQNNLLEYWCMVDFVRPNYLGTKQEFCNMFERPIMNGQCADSTPKDVKLMRFRAHVLHSLLEGFVQRRGHAVLQAALPQKEEHVIFVRLSPIQRQLYNEFMSAIKDSGNIASWSNSNNPIKAFSVCCKIWNHPDILYQVVEQRKDDNDLDLDEGRVINGDVMSANGTAPPQANHKRTYRKKATNPIVQPITNVVNNNANTEADGKAADDAEGGGAKESGGVANVMTSSLSEKKESQVITYEWAVDVMKDYVAGMLEHSGKMVILMDIVDECVAMGDKILVFSQSLYTLTLIEEYLSRRRVPGSDEYWQKNLNYFRLDGGTAGIDREKLINQFNDYNNNRVHLFLLSTRAGCLGINLIGACRVVIFDASWNPCHDCQAVCRVYRYGQNKCCFVYRLVSDNTMEKNIYDRQINKQGISDRVVDELNPQNLLSKKQVDVLMRSEETDVPEIALDNYEEKCNDQLLVKVVKQNCKWLTKEPFTHESLLLDRKDQKLTRHEKRLAKQGYEMDKKMSTLGFSRQSSMYGKTMDGTGIIRFNQRPVASVRPMMSNPLKNGPGPRIISNQFRAPGLKPGVSVQQIQTTTDIIIPGTNTVSDSTSSKIPAGEKVLVIKTPKGVYIRTSQGKIFAVRTAPKSGSTTGTSSTTSSSTSSISSSTTSVSSQQGSIVSTVKNIEPMEVIDDDDDDDAPAEIDNSNSNQNEKDKANNSAAAGPSEPSTDVIKTSKDAETAGSNPVNASKKLTAVSQNAPITLSSAPSTSHFVQPTISTMATTTHDTHITFGNDLQSNAAPSVLASKSGIPPPIKSVLPMQNNRQMKKGKDKNESNFSSPGEGTPVTKEMSAVAPVNPQPFSKPVAQPQPVTNTVVQQMQQQYQNSLLDWDKKSPFESPSLFGLQGQGTGQLGSLDGGMGDLFPNYFKGNSGPGLHSPFLNRSLASSSSTSLPMSSPSSGKAFSDRNTASNKGLAMGSSSSGLHHPVPMTPPSYLPHNPYGMPNPYSWMPSPMWMGASPMDVAHPPHFPGDPSSYVGSSSASEDFGLGGLGQSSNDLHGLDSFGGFSGSFDDRSFSSLLMGDEDANSISQGGGRRSGNRGVLPNSPYRQNPMGYPPPHAPMSSYPYHNPYSPYGMPPHQPPAGYYGPGSNHATSGGGMAGRGGYIPPSMHYSQHPGNFMQAPYDFGGPRNLIQGPSPSTKKNFDIMKGE